MTQYEFDLSELLDALRAGGDIDVIRRSVEMVLQALIDTEATQVIGAGPHERTDNRTNQRNGTRPRLLSTKAGDVELAIPKLRRGSFFPSVLERRRRIDRALFQVVMAPLCVKSSRAGDGRRRREGCGRSRPRVAVSRSAVLPCDSFLQRACGGSSPVLRWAVGSVTAP